MIRMIGNIDTSADKKLRFKQLTKRQRAVAVARDVLEQIELALFIPRQQVYVYLEDTPDMRKSSRFQGQRSALITSQKCVGCAMGASMLSFARLFENIRLDRQPCIMLTDHFKLQVNRRALSKAFSWRTIALMEVCFEGKDRFLSLAEGSHNRSIRVSSSDVKAALIFGEETTSKNRLCGIMQNIIKNDGEFQPAKGDD